MRGSYYARCRREILSEIAGQGAGQELREPARKSAGQKKAGQKRKQAGSLLRSLPAPLQEKLLSNWGARSRDAPPKTLLAAAKGKSPRGLRLHLVGVGEERAGLAEL